MKIGTTVIYETEGLRIECIITDIKTAYGHVTYKIKPVAGSGEKWTRKKLEAAR
jgi:hypothetical protein